MADRVEKTRVGVIGATGMVGQNYLRLLKDHPWFQVTHVSASPRSAGKEYAEAVAGRWVMDDEIPEQVAGLVVGDASDVEEAKDRCDFVFSAVAMISPSWTSAAPKVWLPFLPALMASA